MQSLGNRLLFFIIVFQFHNCYSSIVTRNYNSSNGLVNNSVRCFHEDSNGELWIGTDGGISIYDGYSFKNITVNEGLVGNYIWSIVSDSSGGKWVASYGEGLTYIKNGEFTKYDRSDGLSNVYIRTLYYENKKLLIGTDDGLFQFDCNTKKISKVQYKDSLENPFQVMQFLKIEEKLLVVTRTTGVYEFLIDTTSSSSLEKTRQGNFLFKIIPFSNQFLYCTDIGVFKQRELIGDYTKKIHNNVIWDYAYSSISKDLYLASWNVAEAGGALLRASKDTLENCNTHFSINSKMIWACRFLENDQLAVGTLDNGFYIIDNQLSGVVKVPLSDIKGVFEVDSSTYYYDEIYVYSEKGVPVFTLSKENIKDWLTEKELIKTSLIDSITISNFRLNEHHEINAIKYFNSNFYISTSLGLFRLSKEFEVEKIFRIQVDKFDIIDSTLIYQRPYHEFNIIEDFLSEKRKRKKLNVHQSVPTDVLEYQQIEDSLLIWTKEKGVFAFKKGKRPYKINLNRDYGSIKFINTWENQIIMVNSKDEVFKGRVSREGIKFTPIQIPIKINSIYKASLSNNYLMIHYDNGIYISKGSIQRVINQNNLLNETGNYTSFLSSENLKIAFANSVTHIPLDNIFSYQTRVPNVHLKTKHSVIPYNQNSVVFEIGKTSVHLPNDYEYYYQLNGLDTIPISGEKIYLMNLSSGNYKVEILTYSTFQNNWFTSSSYSFNKLKAPWEKWYFWIFGATLIGGVLTILYYKRKVTSNKRMLERQKIEKKLIRHKLEAIQAKMNPHFMFNSLNSIQNYIIDTDTDNALLYLSEFSKLMRQTLDYSSMNSVSLSEEIKFLERYIRIEQMRFTNKIVLEKTIDESIKNIEVPPMILQPLIENAFIHGLKRDTDAKQVIKLEFKKIDDSIVKIIVYNPIISLKQGNKSHKSFGLESIEERLKLLNHNNSLKVINSKTKFIVEVIIYENEKTLNRSD